MATKKGSTWSRWDLHIHTPKSIVNNYGGDSQEIWEHFITALEALPEDVNVIGITDYYFIDGFIEVMKYKNDGRLQNIEKIFPVLEFRIDTFASTRDPNNIQKINLHVLFDINEDNLEEEIKDIQEKFIDRINLTGLPEHNMIPLSKENLIKESPDGNLNSGFDNCIPSTNQVLDSINSEQWSKKTFIFIGYSEWDNLEFGQQVRPHKKRLFEVANAFFTASPGPNQTRKQEILELFGNKPLVHSMDIHGFDELSLDNYKCYTWVKGDYTFNGLSQIKYEPKDRILLQITNPILGEIKTNVVNSIHFKDTNQWFSDEILPLNSGLVTIVGEKGAGKTALLDMIAVSNNEGIFELDEEHPSSFFFRAKRDSQLDQLKVDVKYRGIDEIEVVKIGELEVPIKSQKEAKVRYLSLKELENYSSNKEQLQGFIQDIINSNDTDIKTLRMNCEDIQKTLSELNTSVSDNEVKLKQKSEIEKFLRNKVQEMEAHLSTEPKNKSAFGEEDEKKFRELLESESKYSKDKVDQNTKKLEIKSFIEWLSKEQKAIIERFVSMIKDRASEYESLDELVSEYIDVSLEVNGIDKLMTEITSVDSRINDIEESLKRITEELKPLKELNQNYEEEQKVLKKWLQKKNELSADIEKLNKELQRFANYEGILSETKINRVKKYNELLIEKVYQKKKYSELKSKIEEDGTITFDVNIEFNEQKFVDTEDTRINHNSGYSKDTILSKLLPIYRAVATKLNSLDAYEDVDEEVVGEISASIMECNGIDNFIKTFFNKEQDKLLKKQMSMVHFYELIFNDYYEVNYDIKYNGKSLRLLSPGQKGLVLMKLFLKLDKSSKPILIDQPEDNLDNRSVYEELKDDFRDVKKRRQVIIATHNPNLVVNTDAEQVIVAHFQDIDGDDRVRITYESGGLEDDDIRELVCKILEGGPDAFKKREERYEIS